MKFEMKKKTPSFDSDVRAERLQVVCHGLRLVWAHMEDGKWKMMCVAELNVGRRRKAL